MHKQKHPNLTSASAENICDFYFFLRLWDICVQYGVNLTFITHVEKCVSCWDCYSNTGHLKNNERCVMLR